MIFKTYFFCPQATSVTIESDHGAYPLQHLGDGDWGIDVELEESAGAFKYRYQVNGQGCFPDPYNAHYAIVDGVYFSFFDPDIGWIDDFPETPLALYHTTSLPDRDTMRALQPTHRFGPGDELIVAVLCLSDLCREDNSLVWVWQAPSRRLYFFEDVIARDISVAFSAVRYDSIPEFGTWTTSCYLNGRFCGTTQCTVRSLGYPPELVRTFQMSWGRRRDRGA